MAKKKKEFQYDFSTTKSSLKSAWYFLWEDNSLASWLANIVVAFVLIKFVLFPILSLLFGTAFPIVAVVSESMEHDGSFDTWWQSQACIPQQPCTQEQWYSNKNITKEEFKQFPFKNGFNKGDVMILFGAKTDKLKKGDIIVYNSIRKYPIIHRVINIESGIFQTKGDHNTEMIQDYYIQDTRGNLYRCYTGEEFPAPASCRPGAKIVTKETPTAIKGLDEFEIQPEEIYGRAVLRIPYIGYVKILAVDALYWVIGLF